MYDARESGSADVACLLDWRPSDNPVHAAFVNPVQQVYNKQQISRAVKCSSNARVT